MFGSSFRSALVFVVIFFEGRGLCDRRPVGAGLAFLVHAGACCRFVSPCATPPGDAVGAVGEGHVGWPVLGTSVALKPNCPGEIPPHFSS